MSPIGVVLDSANSWYMCLPFIGAFLNPGGKRAPLAISKFIEIALILGGGWMLVREQGIRNEEAIKAIRGESKIIQVALANEIGGVKDDISEIKVDIKEYNKTMTEHRVNHSK